MNEDKIRLLLNKIVIRRYVNLYFGDKKEHQPEEIVNIVNEIVSGKRTNDYYIQVDIEKLKSSWEKASQILVDTINSYLSKVKFEHWIHGADSIYKALVALNERLDSPALIIFHYFTQPENEHEKDVFSFIRKFIEEKESIFLGILIISTKPSENWDLAPYSSLDDRYVEYINWNTLDK